MALYDDLNAMFPSHNYFYTVAATDISEALDKCARVTGEPTNVFAYNGQIVMCVQHSLVDNTQGGISWLTAVTGNPVDEVAPE